MNFFENQARARRQSKWLVVLFSLAVLSTMAAMTLVAIVIFGQLSVGAGPLSTSFWSNNSHIIIVTSLATGGVIIVGSLFRMLDLRDGGAKVARELGGTEIDGTTRDPLRRRLLNVVEEMAIASGVPVPSVFVLEHEEGINAFAAGWSPSDAAIAVTRGALESLSRSELQGVIAHEFSHVFNGDMRLNIRLMGILFGILMLALIGRKLTRGASLSNNRDSAGLALAGIAILLIGYIGLFFGRWIKSAVSRQREYLADASAVQFTRNPDGIGGALKKIGALTTGSRLVVNAEEIGHMLFATGFNAELFATHPPLIKRIHAVDPSFDPSDFESIGQQLIDDRRSRRFAREQETREQQARSNQGPGGLPLDPNTLIDQIGQPDATQLLLVSALLAAVPEPLQKAAHSDEWSIDVLLYLLLSKQAETREQQLLLIAQQRGSDSEQQVSTLFQLNPNLPVRQRLPLMELTFPTLRRRPEAELVALMNLIEQLIDIDGTVEVFEYVMARLLNREIEDSLSPVAARTDGSVQLVDHPQSWIDLLAIVAMHGQANDAGSAMAALKQAAASLDTARAEQLGSDASVDWSVLMDQWTERLDQAFAALAHLALPDKQRLIEALLVCIQHDGKIVTVEYELLRLVAGVLRVPLPVMEEPE
ncbi:MAG: M48 family metallopeptidase [Pseudomonadota bacterium]